MTDRRRAPAEALIVAAILSAAGCAGPKHQLVLSPKPAAELRAIQSMNFDGTDSKTLLHATITALLDLGYSIDSVDPASGSVSASKGAAALTLTAVVEKGPYGSVLRCDAEVNLGLKRAAGSDASRSARGQKSACFIRRRNFRRGTMADGAIAYPLYGASSPSSITFAIAA